MQSGLWITEGFNQPHIAVEFTQKQSVKPLETIC